MTTMCLSGTKQLPIQPLLWRTLEISGFKQGIVISTGIDIQDAPESASLALIEPNTETALARSLDHPSLAVHAKQFAGHGLPSGHAAAFVGALEEIEQVSDVLDLVSPGGYAILGCPVKLLDSRDMRLRRSIAARGDLISVLRFQHHRPMDLLILRRREHQSVRPLEQNGSWIQLVPATGRKGGSLVNRWLVEHPDSTLETDALEVVGKVLAQDLKIARQNGLKLDPWKSRARVSNTLGLLDSGLHRAAPIRSPRKGQVRANFDQKGLEIFSDRSWLPIQMDKVGIKAKLSESLMLLDIKEVARKLSDCREHRLSPPCTQTMLERELEKMLGDYEAEYGPVGRSDSAPHATLTQRQIDSYIRSRIHRWRQSLGKDVEDPQVVPLGLLAQWFEQALNEPAKTIQEHLDFLANDPDLELLVYARELLRGEFEHRPSALVS